MFLKHDTKQKLEGRYNVRNLSETLWALSKTLFITINFSVEHYYNIEL